MFLFGQKVVLLACVEFQLAVSLVLLGVIENSVGQLCFRIPSWLLLCCYFG